MVCCRQRINNKIKKIKANAFKLYNEKTNRPNSKISKRCCDFKVLEEKCRKYKRDSPNRDAPFWANF